MKARIATVLVGLLMIVAAGCVVRSGPGAAGGSGPTATSGEGAGSALVIQNHSSQAICFVLFSPTSQSTWGDDDRLEADEVIGPGQTRGWNVPSDSYDVQLQDCDRNVLLDRRGIAVAGDGVLLTVQ